MSNNMTLTKFTKMKIEGLLNSSKETKFIDNITEVTDSEVYLFLDWVTNTTLAGAAGTLWRVKHLHPDLEQFYDTYASIGNDSKVALEDRMKYAWALYTEGISNE